jgi:hypothetical protein
MYVEPRGKHALFVAVDDIFDTNVLELDLGPEEL